MSLFINNNSMANTAARNLNNAYSKLSDSTEKLSSGMRINSAADDAAGLAVREMMRAEVTTLNQGVRNANDAISMIQTADGALSVIDEKLIRMNELAEQAATGTYTDEQRAIIDQEYQSMADEITRIAVATDFNGTKLLDGSLDPAEGGEPMTIHFGTGNDAAEDKYDIEIEEVSAKGMGLGSDSLDYTVNNDGTVSTSDGNDIYTNADGDVFILDGSAPLPDSSYEKAEIAQPTATDPAKETEAKALLSESNLVGTLAADGTVTFDYNAAPAGGAGTVSVSGGQLMVEDASGVAVAVAVYSQTDADGNVTYTTSDTGANAVLDNVRDDMYAIDDDGGITLDGQVVNDDGTGTLTLAADDGAGTTYSAATVAVTQEIDEDAKAALDKALGGTEEYAGSSIATQEGAAAALDAIGVAIEMKDKNRANLGAYENRLDATISNLEVQSENLSAAESRISDVDVATEMTEYTLRQTISQAATSMLAQANTLPETALSLIGG